MTFREGYRSETERKPKRLTLEQIKEMNDRLEDMCLSWDIPYERRPASWQKEIMNTNEQ